MLVYSNCWLYQGRPFDLMEHPGFYGFVYIITNLLTGRMYIGRKYFKTKGKPWQKYYGSCKPLLADIKEFGVDNFKREILGLYKTRGQVNYQETKLLFSRNVFETQLKDGSRAYYNENILGRYFLGKV